MDKADLNLDGIIDSTDVTIMDNYLIDGKLRLDIKQGSRKIISKWRYACIC